MDRRAVLRVGAFGLGGLTLEQMLRLKVAQGASRGRAKGAILFWTAGGPSHIDMNDMKPPATREIRGPSQPIETNLAGLFVNEHMPRHTKIADKSSFIRSNSHEHTVHDDGSHWMRTGYP